MAFCHDFYVLDSEKSIHFIALVKKSKCINPFIHASWVVLTNTSAVCPRCLLTKILAVCPLLATGPMCVLTKTSAGFPIYTFIMLTNLVQNGESTWSGCCLAYFCLAWEDIFKRAGECALIETPCPLLRHNFGWRQPEICCSNWNFWTDLAEKAKSEIKLNISLEIDSNYSPRGCHLTSLVPRSVR